jgi:hypothetical protein
MVIALLRQRGLEGGGGGLGFVLGGVRALDALVQLLQTEFGLFELSTGRRFRRLHGLRTDRLFPLPQAADDAAPIAS